MAEKKATTKKAATETKAAAKKTETVKTLAAAEKALSVKEIAKAAKISEEETLLGLGWLFKEGKLAAAEDKVTLA